MGHMARTQASLISGVLKKMVANLYIFFHPYEGLFQRKISRKGKAFTSPVQQQLMQYCENTSRGISNCLHVISTRRCFTGETAFW